MKLLVVVVRVQSQMQMPAVYGMSIRFLELDLEEEAGSSVYGLKISMFEVSIIDVVAAGASPRHCATLRH